MDTKPLERAVECAGGQTALARSLTTLTSRKITQSHIWNWLHRDRRVPAEYVIPIERAVEGKVSRHEMRPDIYPADDLVARRAC